MEPTNKTYRSVQEMVDDIDPEFAEEFRKHQKTWPVRLRKLIAIQKIRLRLLWEKLSRN